MPPKAFLDLHALPEDERIAVIGQAAEQGNRTAFFVDDDTAGDRYLRKLQQRHKVQLISRVRSGIGQTVVITIGPVTQ